MSAAASTTARHAPWRARVINRAAMTVAERVAPAAGAWLAARAARRVPAAVRARPAPAEARGSGPLVLLLDGYHGRGQTQPLVPPLVQAGFRAVTVGVPSHAPDGPQRYERGIVPEFIAALAAARQLHGDPYAVVAHSLGGYAAQLAVLGPLRGTPCLVLIEALPDAASIAGVLARRARLGPRTRERLPLVLARQAGLTVADADAVARAREDVSPRRVLVAWDDSSSCVPAGVSLDLALAWGAASYTTSSRGHVGLLSDPRLHARVVAHLAAPAAPAPAAGLRSAAW